MVHYLIIEASSTIEKCVVQDLLSKGHTDFTTARKKEKIVPDKILNASNFQEVNEIFNKAGSINDLVLSAAAIYASMNLRFNAVAPGLVKTALTSNITNNEISLKFSEAKHPLGRIGSLEEIAKVVVFLLDNKNSWITWQIIAVDRGLSTIKQKVCT